MSAPKRMSDADMIASLRGQAQKAGLPAIKLNALAQPATRLSDEEVLARAGQTAKGVEPMPSDGLQARVQQLEVELASRPPQELPLDVIDSVPGRRRQLSQEQFEELRENLRVNPLVHPITVRRKTDGRYEVVSGENRLAAYREIGKSRIQVSVLEVSEQLAERAAFYANLIAHDLPDYEKFKGFEREQRSTGASLSEMARLAGVPKATIGRLFAFARLPSQARAELERRPDAIGAACAEELARICTDDNAPRVAEAVRLVAEGRLKQLQAAAHVTPRRRAPRATAAQTTIKAGKFKFAELRSSGPVVRIEFTAEVDMDKACERIAALLSELAAES